MLAREELERDQGRAATGRALVLEPPAKELGLLPEAELADRPIRNGTFAVVVRASRGLQLVRPLRSQARQFALGAWNSDGEGGFGYLSKCKTYDEDAVSKFFRAFQFQGPERFQPEQLQPGL